MTNCLESLKICLSFRLNWFLFSPLFLLNLCKWFQYSLLKISCFIFCWKLLHTPIFLFHIFFYLLFLFKCFLYLSFLLTNFIKIIFSHFFPSYQVIPDFFPLLFTSSYLMEMEIILPIHTSLISIFFCSLPNKNWTRCIFSFENQGIFFFKLTRFFYLKEYLRKDFQAKKKCK